MAGESTPDMDHRRRRNRLIGVGVAGLIVGLLLGAAGEDTSTVTDTQTVVETRTERVPVVRVKTVTQVRRVVRTHTVTAEAAPVASGGYDDSYESYDSGDSGGSYAGLNCSEIGHSFSVAPGSDPEHDADNDGVACESY